MTTDLSHRSRQPKGSPVGGELKAEQYSRGADLDTPFSPETPPHIPTQLSFEDAKALRDTLPTRVEIQALADQMVEDNLDTWGEWMHGLKTNPDEYGYEEGDEISLEGDTEAYIHSWGEIDEDTGLPRIDKIAVPQGSFHNNEYGYTFDDDGNVSTAMWHPDEGAIQVAYNELGEVESVFVANKQVGNTFIAYDYDGTPTQIHSVKENVGYCQDRYHRDGSLQCREIPGTGWGEMYDENAQVVWSRRTVNEPSSLHITDLRVQAPTHDGMKDVWNDVRHRYEQWPKSVDDKGFETFTNPDGTGVVTIDPGYGNPLTYKFHGGQISTLDGEFIYRAKNGDWTTEYYKDGSIALAKKGERLQQFNDQGTIIREVRPGAEGSKFEEKHDDKGNIIQREWFKTA